MDHEVWIFDGRAPELLCRAPSLPAARARWGHSRHAAIFDGEGALVDAKRESDPKRLAAIEAARAGRAAPSKPARALPRAAATEPMPERPSEPPSTPVEAPAPPAASTVVQQVSPAPAKASRPAATRPPLPRRRVAPVAAAPATPATPAAPPAAEPAAPSRTTDVPAPDPATAHRIEQLLGEVEALTTDLGVARRDLATTVRQLNELSDRTRAERAQITTERDEAHELLSLAMSTGLAAVLDARAETDTVLRQSAALSQELGALRDARDSSSPAAPRVELDEAVLERVAARAARLVLRASRDDQKLRALAARVGGVEALARLVNFVQEILRGWQP